MSDWYAFTVLLFQSLLLVGPYGGVHRPTPPAPRLHAGARALRGLVRYDVDGDRVVRTRAFTDTEPFVRSHSQVLVWRDGLAIVDASGIRLLRQVIGPGVPSTTATGAGPATRIA